MGAAYYVVLNTEDPGFDTTVDGKALARHARQIDSIAASLGFKALDEYCSQSLEDARVLMMDLMELEEGDDLPPEAEETLRKMPPETWFEATVGLDYARQVSAHIRDNPSSVGDPDAVLNDFDALATVLQQAAERELKWHLQVDF